MTDRTPPRIDWAKVVKSTGTSNMLTGLDSIEAATPPSVPPVLATGNEYSVAGMKVQITGITRHGPDVVISARLLRQVKRKRT